MPPKSLLYVYPTDAPYSPQHANLTYTFALRIDVSKLMYKQSSVLYKNRSRINMRLIVHCWSNDNSCHTWAQRSRESNGAVTMAAHCPPVILFYRCSLDLLSFFFRRLISEVDCFVLCFFYPCLSFCLIMFGRKKNVCNYAHLYLFTFALQWLDEYLHIRECV